jgi:hypothetical protein
VQVAATHAAATDQPQLERLVPRVAFKRQPANPGLKLAPA